MDYGFPASFLIIMQNWKEELMKYKLIFPRFEPKKAVIAAIFLGVALLAWKEKANNMKDREEYVEEIIDCLGCEYELIEDAKDISVVMAEYKHLLTEGKTEGFTPVIVIPNENMYEIVKNREKKDNYDYSLDAIIENSKKVDAMKFLNEWFPGEMPDNQAMIGEVTESHPENSFKTLLDYGSGRLYSTLVIAKIPTGKPWELAAWIPMGGFNNCPAPDDQVAVFKYWYEKYGAVPAVVNYDTWELYVENPVDSKEEAKSLAMEHIGFCNDILWEGEVGIDSLADSIIHSHVWSFWWD